MSRCGCGCPSITLEASNDVAPARYHAADTPYGDASWFPIAASGEHPAGDAVEITLHVVHGRLHELEIWSGFGHAAYPDPASLQRDVQLPIKTRYGMALAVADRVQPFLPSEVIVAPDRFARLDVRWEEQVESCSGHGDIAAIASGILDDLEMYVSDLVGRPWLTCPSADEDQGCRCSDAHAEWQRGGLALWYGDRANPTLTLPPITLDELEGLSTRWASDWQH